MVRSFALIFYSLFSFSPLASQSNESQKETTNSEKKENEEPKEFSWVMNNYFSFGIDSQVCLDFHNMREGHPGLFKSKVVNMGYVSCVFRTFLEETNTTISFHIFFN